MVSSCSHVTSFTTWCCHNTFTSFTVLPRKTCSRLSMIRTGPSSKVSSASTTSSHQSTTSRILGVLLEYGDMEYRVHTRLSYSRSITCQTPRSRKAPTRLTLQRIFSTLLLFGTSHVPLLALVTDSRTNLITIASQACCLTPQVQFLRSTNCLSNMFTHCLKVRISMALSACSLRRPQKPARRSCITLTSCLHKGVSNIVQELSSR